jgi:two-component system, chemotaxis family, sensor histidine kinase and response regulator PixL
MDLQTQARGYFEQEAPELLEAIETALLALPAKRAQSPEGSRALVHELMRSTHTLKGSAANAGLQAVATIAHSLEDVVNALYHPEVNIDPQLHSLLLAGFGCLRDCWQIEIHRNGEGQDEILDRSSDIFIALHHHLGDWMKVEVILPSSTELGFDLTASMFEMGVTEKLDYLAHKIDLFVNEEIEEEDLVVELFTVAEIFLGLGESLNLSGFVSISSLVPIALNRHPDKILEIARSALEDWQNGRELVLAGDRTVGGTPSEELRAFTDCQISLPIADENIRDENLLGSSRLTEELSHFQVFLQSNLFSSNKPLSSSSCNFYIRTAHILLTWLHHVRNIPISDVGLSLLVPNNTFGRTPIALIDYIQNWIDRFLKYDTYVPLENNVWHYRQVILFKIAIAIAHFRYINDDEIASNIIEELPVMQHLYNALNNSMAAYRKLSPVSEQDKKWLDRWELVTVREEIIEDSYDVIAAFYEEDSQDIEGTVETEDDEELAEAIWLNDPEESIEDTDLDIDSEPTILRLPDVEMMPIRSEITTKQVAQIRVDKADLERSNSIAGNLTISLNRMSSIQQELHGHYAIFVAEWHRHLQSIVRLQYSSQQQKHHSDRENILPEFDSLELERDNEITRDWHSLWAGLDRLNSAIETFVPLDRELERQGERSQQLLHRLREEITHVQMQPLQPIFDRFAPMLASLSRSKDKQVELELSGGEVPISKLVAEKLYDPLLHLMRNAFDHGIESPAERVKKSKNITGKISLCAYNLGNRTTIEITDDGKGIDWEVIREKVVSMNLADRFRAATMTPTELASYLFSSGFSTADRISDISGRGVGLDVVKYQIEALGGTIVIKSQLGIQTTFQLHLPLTMTTDRFFTCMAGGKQYALSAGSIKRIILAAAEQQQTANNSPILVLPPTDRTSIGYVYPIYELADLLAYHHLRQQPSPTSLARCHRQIANDRYLSHRLNGERYFAIVATVNGEVAIALDWVDDERELVVRPLGSAIYALDCILGGCLLGSGDLILAIDAFQLPIPITMPASIASPPPVTIPQKEIVATAKPKIDLATPPTSPPPEKTTTKPIASPIAVVSTVADAVATVDVSVASHKLQGLPISLRRDNYQHQGTTVLVVEDSLSYRQTTIAVLKNAGYNPIGARDGLDGLEQLRGNPQISFILCDLEMPRMNGYEFLQAKAKDSKLAVIPTVVLSSRTQEKHRSLAMSLGARNYLAKPVTESDLLGTIEQILVSNNN